jgi:glutamyl-tRNA(Gln) amidotransferase subunit E
VKDYGINAQQARQMVRESYDESFERILMGNKDLASVAATIFLNIYSEMQHDGIDTTAITDDDLIEVLGMLKQNRFAKEALPKLLREMAVGTKAEDAIKKLGLEAVDSDEARKIIEQIVNERSDFVKEKGMAAIGGLMGPVMGALRGKIDGKQANELLTEAIKKIL